MNYYVHTQASILAPLVLLLGGLLSFMTAMALERFVGSETLVYGAAVAGTVLSTLAGLRLQTLTIEVYPPHLLWWNGIGVHRYTLLLSDIVDVRPREFERGERGYLGIQWLHRHAANRVAGLRGVEVSTRDGRSVLLGTDEPDELLSALKVAMGGNQSET